MVATLGPLLGASFFLSVSWTASNRTSSGGASILPSNHKSILTHLSKLNYKSKLSPHIFSFSCRSGRRSAPSSLGEVVPSLFSYLKRQSLNLTLGVCRGSPPASLDPRAERSWIRPGNPALMCIKTSCRYMH